MRSLWISPGNSCQMQRSNGICLCVFKNENKYEEGSIHRDSFAQTAVFDHTADRFTMHSLKCVQL